MPKARKKAARPLLSLATAILDYPGCFEKLGESEKKRNQFLQVFKKQWHTCSHRGKKTLTTQKIQPIMNVI